MARRYLAPTSVVDLIAALAGADDAMLIAGGQSLLPSLAERGIRAGLLVDIGRIDALKRIAVDAAGVTIGAGVAMADLMRGHVAQRYPALAAAAAAVGNHVVRGRSTIGGCLGWANPRAEIPMILVAHDATIVTDRREIAADALMTGAYRTILERSEPILSVRVPPPPRMVFDELIARNSTGRAIVSVACADAGSGAACVTLAGLTARPIRNLTVSAGQVASEADVRAAIAAVPDVPQTISLDYRIAAAAALIRRCRERLAA